MTEDPAVALVCGYLRANGYFTLTEFGVVEATSEGFRSVTDLDVVAVRLPDLRDGSHRRRVWAGIASGVDPRLDVATDRLDVLLVEVKQGRAHFNPNLRRREVLLAALRRVGGDYGAPPDRVVERLRRHGRFRSATAQVRLVAAGGHGEVPRALTLHHAVVLAHLERLVAGHLEELAAMEGGDPVVEFLELVAKARGELPQS